MLLLPSFQSLVWNSGLAGQKGIETVPKHGYRFVPAVDEILDGDIILEKSTITRFSIDHSENFREDDAGRFTFRELPKRRAWLTSTAFLTAGALLCLSAIIFLYPR